ncbi:MAG: hypothetical protein JSW39_23825 [Desulfobacterales bacterium]|nr:MAG: hypothetical protein JSW39_23825 [Desulfobacterales bacterium]
MVAVACMAGLLMALGMPCAAYADAQERLNQFWSDEYGKIVLPHEPLTMNRDFVEEGLAADFEGEVLAKAQPDECFQGVGNPLNVFHPTLGFAANYPGDLTEQQMEDCLDIAVTDYDTPSGRAQPKVNQAYVWGLTKFRDNLWFGTIANTHCLVISGFLGNMEPSLNSSWVCEGSEGALQDFRPPRAFYYNTNTAKLFEVTPKVLDAGAPHSLRLQSTIGLRSAGSRRGVVFLGGISQQGVNLFAFNARTGKFFDSISYNGQGGRPLYTNIRQWRVIRGQLYVGMGKPGGGEVLRWTGDRYNPFSFEKVGEIGGDPAYLTPHQGRIFVSTWPAGAGQMSIWMSPPIGEDRMLTAADADGWESVWEIADYDPELAVVATTGGGALMSYQGYLYWGTMHVPGLSLLAWQSLYGGTAPDEDAQAALLGTYRPISIFRGKAFGRRWQKVELLYGNSHLPKYTPGVGWETVPNNMGQQPKFGLAGFNNFFNNYTWWMEVFDDQLFVGTMDFLYLGAAGIRDEFEFPPELTQLFEGFYGADLWRFRSRDFPADPVSLSGVGNFTNYGVRTMVSDDFLYLGMANPMNLLTDPADDMPEGGWELIRLPPAW